MKVATNDTFYNEVIQPVWCSSLLEHDLTIANFSKAMDHFCSDLAVSKAIEELKVSILSSSQTHDIYDSHPALKTRIDYAKKFKAREVDIKQPEISSDPWVDLHKVFDDTTPDESPVSKLFNDWDLINEKIAELFNQRLLLMKAAMPK